MRQVLLYLLIGPLTIGCGTVYDDEELKAIQDVTNEYLSRNPYSVLYPYPYSGEEISGTPIDSLDLRVYISDALLPIAQVKEDNEWMFQDEYTSTPDSAIFYGIVNSQNFQELTYREFDKRRLQLVKPYRQLNESQEKLRANEEYSIIHFSRVCFDDKKENGVVTLEYLIGDEVGTMNGYFNALLIRKAGDKWTYIPRK